MGGHTHVRVFMNSGKCGDLCFRNEEFELVREHLEDWTLFIEEHDPADAVHVATTKVHVATIPKSVTVDDLVSRGWSFEDAKTIIETRDGWKA